ncbi:hypothetical protein B0T17DRAFT_85336 [Bombardia bombarda]|uniref:Uncharacterized protein n=1 Tax=Bombardia bombarda TaxID=252184 RepID=A0AA39XMX4_9PEZI|nr:hypothetical protein B0T17DRAFT_85336 [Bombardia bombarda]
MAAQKRSISNRIKDVLNYSLDGITWAIEQPSGYWALGPHYTISDGCYTTIDEFQFSSSITRVFTG